MRFFSFRKYIIFTIGLVFSVQIHAQTQSTEVYLLCKAVSSSAQKVLQRLDYKKTYPDSLSAHQALLQLLQDLQKEAYLEARIKQLTFRQDTLWANLHLGSLYIWKELQAGNLPSFIQNQVNFKPKFYQNKPFLFSEVELLQEKILDYAEDHGFPFASVRLAPFTVQGNEVSASLDYDRGTAIVFDSLQIKGDARVKSNFLAKYLRIRPGQTFSQERIKKAERLLKQLPYLRMEKPAQVDFKAKKAYVNLELKKKKSNQIDGIVGILPNEQEGNLLVTGEFNLKLKNLFRSGKSFSAQWQRLRPESQLLDLAYEHPLLFGSRVDAQADFYLIRQDSSFINREIGLTLYYNLGNSGRFLFNLNDRQSTVGDENLFQDFSELPDVSDMRFFSYGLGYEWNNLDDFFYPSRGTQFEFSFNLGNKNIDRNPFVADSLYEGLSLSGNQLVLAGKWHQYFPTGKRSVLMLRANAGGVFNETLFFNDLFRLGGLQTLRGHNENIFFASTFAIGTAEWRWFFGSESYVLLFYDQGYLRTEVLDDLTQDYPLGVGLGLSFSVKAGIFNLVYALGQSNDQRLSFSRSKIHFGLINRF